MGHVLSGCLGRAKTCLAVGLVALTVSGCGGCKSKGKTAGSEAEGGAADAKVTRDAAPETSAPSYLVPEAGPADDSLPPKTSDELTIRAKHLLEAIGKDDGDLAADLIFPRDAYLVVKDVPDPGKQWDAKMLAAFRAQIHKLHKAQKGIERATFSSFEVGQPVVQALPKKKDLKRSLWRAKQSRLNYAIDGKPGHVEIAEMTGWQGSWYVTQLRTGKP